MICCYPNIYRWASHVIALTGASCAAKMTNGAAGAKSAVVSSSKNDDFDDMFGMEIIIL